MSIEEVVNQHNTVPRYELERKLEIAVENRHYAMRATLAGVVNLAHYNAAAQAVDDLVVALLEES